MQSSSTIRTCSKIMMVIIIIASVIAGIAFLAIGYDFYPVLGLIVIVVGCFSAIMMNALFRGFADIIDNTYAVALKANGVEVKKKIQQETGDVSFQQLNKPTKDKIEYANELMSKGLISKEDYDNITKGN